MMFGFFLVPLFIIGAIVYALGWRPQFTQFKPPETSQNALEILKARFARGEITREEFDQARQALQS